MITLRPSQEEILKYRQGKMGISAVPGSGKTWTLSLLAGDIIHRGMLEDDQEVLVVTLVNSAVDIFYERVSSIVQRKGLLPHLGYRVRTLHGLAHDIVRERPALVNLADNFQIIDEREADSIRNDIAQAWLHSHPAVLSRPYSLEGFLNSELKEERLDWARRDKLPELVQGIALSFIRYAKDCQYTPKRLQAQLENLPVPLPLAEMGWELYADYQRALVYRGAVDFDDLIRLALQALELDTDFLERLQHRWPYILEDEAQDSSRLQEEILKKLVGRDGNWVRVGDPNQAIYETFTTANPKYLRDFIQRDDVLRQDLPESGRSTPSIIRLANYLVKWTQENHPIEAVRDGLQAPPWIEQTQPNDPQPNPPDTLDQIFLTTRKFTPDGEIQVVVDSLARWLPEHKDGTVAVLAPRNQRAFELVNELKKRDLPYDDSLLRSSSSTRFSAGVLGNLLHYLADPQSAARLATVYKVWRRADRKDSEARGSMENTAELLRKIRRVEDYLFPGPQNDWLVEIDLAEKDPQAYAQLVEFRELVHRWQGAILLPVDQIVLTLAQDLLSEPAELALAHKLAVLLRRATQAHASWRLPELTEELSAIARNERRFLGFSSEDSGFNPEDYKGKVVVSTMHKGKGLEWDRVYLMSVNNYDFPSGLENDPYISEKWYIRDYLNLEAEALAQLDAAFSADRMYRLYPAAPSAEYQWYEEGTASSQARLDYVRERLRLLYVGITRAKKELIITWNSGRRGELKPAVPLVVLESFWEEHHDDIAE